MGECFIFIDIVRINLQEIRIQSDLSFSGYWLLFALGIVCVPALMSSFGWRKCSRKKLFGEQILEEEEKVLKEILRISANEKLAREVKERIRGEQWEESFDVARPTISEQEEQQHQAVG